jgi:hypothetical protein
MEMKMGLRFLSIGLEEGAKSSNCSSIVTRKPRGGRGERINWRTKKE